MFGYLHILSIVLLKTIVGLIQGLWEVLVLLCRNLATPFVAGGSLFLLYMAIRQRGWSHLATAMVIQRFLRQKYYRMHQKSLLLAKAFVQDTERQERHNHLRKTWGLPTKNSLDLAH